MITWGFVASYSDAVTVGTPFAINGVSSITASYILVGTAGDIVWQNAQGNAQWLPGAQAGSFYPIGAAQILATGTVNGTPRTTTASGMVWFASNKAV